MMQLSRRTLLATGLSAGAVALAPMRAHALTTEQAVALVDRAATDIYAVIESGRPEAQLYADFERIFDRYADTRYIAGYALGADARRATPDQVNRFIAAFRVYVARKYGSRFREFIGGQLQITGATPNQNWIEVSTVTQLQGRAPLRADFHCSDRPGRPVFFNLIIEGVNMLVQERQELGAMLDRRGGNIDQLIADLGTIR